MGVDAGRDLSAVALGKPAQMPYVWLPRRDLRFTIAEPVPRWCPGELVAVPNPLKSLG